MSTPFSSCWPSVRTMFAWKGVKVAALLLFGLAAKAGANGRAAIVFAQGPPPGALVKVKPLSAAPPSGVPDQAVIACEVAFGPQVGGLVRVAVGPPLSLTWTESKGTCGASLTTAVSWPVWRLAITLPTRRTEIPRAADSAASRILKVSPDSGSR